MSIKSRIKSNVFLKKIVLGMLIPANDHRPRLWVRWFLNPFLNKRGRRSIIRWKSRLDVFPFNKFELGSKSIIEEWTVINNGVGDVCIGNDTLIGIGCVIIGPVTIGNNVMLAQNIVISGLNHGYKNIALSPSLQPVECKTILIGDDVWVGANSVITAGVHIGKHCVIGAGSVVTKDIPDYSVAVGNPATIIRRYNPMSEIWEKISPKTNL